MDTPKKKPRRNIRGSSAALESPLQVRKLNEIMRQKARSALWYRIKGDKYFSHLTPFYFFRKRSIMDKKDSTFFSKKRRGGKSWESS